MFKELDKYSELNPIRPHIELAFKKVSEKKLLENIIKDIGSKLNPKYSRAIVFCNSRRLTEQNATESNSYFIKNDSLKNKAGYYHAGMDAENRDRTFNHFKNGKILILFSTKAFGMGMDIPNIHHVYHFEPSSSFEDYLQEVGRAGRDINYLEKVGISEKNPIKATCFYTKDSFSKSMDWMQKTQASWNDMSNAFEAYKAYRKRFIKNKMSSKKDTYLPMPINILSKSEKYKDSSSNLSNLFRLSIYWLEMANRIVTENYIPAFLEFKNEGFFDNDLSDSIIDDNIQSLYRYIFNKKTNFYNDELSTLVEGSDLIHTLKLKNRESLFSLVLNAQKKDVLKLVNEIKIDLTNSAEHELSLKKYTSNNNLQYLECIKVIGNELIDQSNIYQKTAINLDYIEKISKDVIEDILINQFLDKLNLTGDQYDFGKTYLITEDINKTKSKDENFRTGINLIKKGKREVFELLQTQRKILLYKKYENKMKVAFNLISLNSNVKCSSIFSENKKQIVQNILLKNKKTKIKNDLGVLCADTITLFHKLDQLPSKVVDINELILDLNINENTYSYVENLFILLRKLGYLNFSGGLIPMAIQMKFNNLEKIGNTEEDDKLKYEYEETLKLKKLRLIVLQAFSKIKIKKDQNDFILDYFKKSSSQEVIGLLEDYSGISDKLLSGFREEALKIEFDRLNSEQQNVYSANIRANTSVLAGPGTGKTHTLVLRVAKLIQKDNISPNKILVLAYNRSVVEELKIRLKNLFLDLGYKNLINSLQVYTFHGLIGAILHRNNIEIDNISHWEKGFLDLYNERKRRILKSFGDVEYVFIDEFQDITPQRMKILKIIAPKNKVFITAIGDPNQSIYGYERANEGGSRAPEPYYSQFNEIYKPKEYKLKTNYRSSQKIIDSSLKILPPGAIKIPIETNKDNPKYSEDSSTVEMLGTGNWHINLNNLLNSEDCKEIAIMFRTNEELYKEYSRIKETVEAANFEIKIIGSSFNFSKQREIAFVLEMIEKSKSEEEIIDHIKLSKYINDKVKIHYPNWSFQLLDDLIILLKFFIKNNSSNSITYGDFVEFVIELTKKDDGQLFSVLKKSYGENINKQVILTTIHKVKGLEFQNVIVPASFAKLPFDNEDIEYNENDLKEIFDEERRLLYVAYSRAEQNLFFEKGEREECILAMEKYNIEDNITGIPIKNGDNNTFISWKAQKNDNYTNYEFTHNFIHKSLKIGQELFIKKIGYYYYLLTEDNNKIERFSSRITKGFKYNSYRGIYVDSISRYTYEECILYDDNNEQNFAQLWSAFAIGNSYIYLINFYGYAIER